MATSILITGAGGLIGTWLCRRLESEHVSVTAVRRPETDLLRAGVPTTMIEDARPDAVVHLAWSASGDPNYRESEDNERWVEATVELLDACRKRDVMLWATGTAVDGNAGAADAYARSKADLHRRMAAEIDDGTVGWLRPYYVFDDVAGRPSLVAQALWARDHDETLVLRHPDGEHDFVHAADVASAVALAVRHRAMGELPIGSGTTHRVCECVEALGARWTSSANPPPEWSAHDHEAADISRLTSIGWSPTTTQEFFSHG
jgi:nucleoside-diphosphate-sugar epimerase